MPRAPVISRSLVTVVAPHGEGVGLTNNGPLLLRHVRITWGVRHSAISPHV